MTKTYRLLLFTAITIFVAALPACNHASLEDRAEKEARDYTERYCPTPVQNMQRTDSIGFDRHTHTFSYYYRLNSAADNSQAIKKVRNKIKSALLSELKGNTGSKAYKEQGYNFRYVLRSEKTKEILYEVTFSEKDYK